MASNTANPQEGMETGTCGSAVYGRRGLYPRLILATSTNAAYWPRAAVYIHTLLQHSRIDNQCLTLDFAAKVRHRAAFHNTHFQQVDSAELKLPLNNFCIQHGEFCDFIPGDESDVILFTDADLTMQRPFSEEELTTLRNLKPLQVFVGYNAGPKDTLEDEAHRLGLKVPMKTLEEWWGVLGPCFNWGCVAATRKTWETICKIYVENFETLDAHLHHVAKQQWLLSSITDAYFEHVEMPTSFHCHRHYGPPSGCELRDGLVYCKDELVLFAHKWDR